MFTTKPNKVMLLLCSGALIFSATGCVGNADPVQSTSAQAPSPPSANSASPTVSPTTEKPTPTPIPGSAKGPAKNWPVPKMPEAAKEKSEAGIIAFTEHWFNVLEYMYITNDTKPIKAVTSPYCTLCAKDMIDPSDGLAKNSAWTVGGKLSVQVTLAALPSKYSGISNFRMEQEDLLVYSSTGEYNGKFPATIDPDVGALTLEYNKGWQVVDLQWLDTK